MTKREVVLKTIRGEATAYTPYHFDLTVKMADRLGEYYGFDNQGAEDFIGNHLLYLRVESPKGAGNADHSLGDRIYLDEFGVKWDVESNYDIGDWGIVDNAVKDLDFSGYKFPDGTGEGHFDKAIELMGQYKDRLNVMCVNGPFILGWCVTGMDDFLAGMISEEKTIEYILENTTNYIVNIIETLPEEVDAVRLLDDWGMQSGLLFSKPMWKKFIYPRFRTIVDAMRKKGVVVMHHSCGNTTELFPYFIELGIDMYDPVQPEALDIAYIKKEYGKDIALFGGLGSQSIIPFGTPDEVVKKAGETLALLGEGGKYVFGPAGSVPTEAPLENVIALVEFCKKEMGS